MTPKVFLDSVINPRAKLLAEHDSAEARCLLLAIAGQESDWTHRLHEQGGGRGFWQCERHGAVLTVLTSDATHRAIEGICAALCIPIGLDDVFEAVAWNDTLAYWIARLALLQDPATLPAIGDESGAWSTYARVWRPGHPRLETWADRYGAAVELFAPAEAIPSPATT